MADVMLTIGAQPNIDFSQLEADLNAIFSKYEKSDKYVFNIEFKLSSGAQSSLNNIDAALQSIQQRADKTAASLRSINSALQDVGKKDSGGSSRNALLYKENIKAIKDYFDTLKKFKSLNTDITNNGGKFESKSGNWARLAEELNKTAEAYNNISNATKDLPDSMKSDLAIKMADSQKQFDLWLEESTNKVADKSQKDLEKIAKLDRAAASLQDSISGKLRSYSAAERSGNAGSREAYANMRDRIQELSNYRDALNDTDKSVNELAKDLEKMKADTAEDTSVIKANGDAHKAWAQRFKEVAEKFGVYLSASQMMMMAVRSMKQIVNEAVNIDSAMNQMQVVTRASSAQMQQFGNTAAKVAKQTASSMTDVIDSATTYARLGYNMDTSTTLAKYTSMISKVGDIEVPKVQSAVTAIVKAFDIDAGNTAQVEAVFDKLVTVGNNLPVSVSELAEGLNNASSSLAAAGNSYEQSLALLAASNATVQDISKSSTGLRTITARIRNTKTELDSLGESMSSAEYDNIVQTLTKYKVSLTDSDGNLRNTYDIIKDIAGVAKELKATSPNDYAALAETLAGTRMQNVFFSLVENFDEAQKAIDLMDASGGALNDAFGTYSDSIKAHIDTLKASYQELSTVVVDSGLAKGIVDIGSGFMSLTTSIVKLGGTLPTLLALLGIIQNIKNIS